MTTNENTSVFPARWVNPIGFIMQSSSSRHYKQIINPCLEDVSPEMYVHDKPSTQVAYSTKQTKAMLGYLNKANEEEAVNGRTDRGNERGMSKKEACMNTATTNRGCYSRLSTPPQVGSGGRVLRETTKASHFNFSLAAYVQCCYLDVAAINWMRSTFYCCIRLVAMSEMLERNGKGEEQ